jgi:GNAT superfamily N-acetyltransferase
MSLVIEIRRASPLQNRLVSTIVETSWFWHYSRFLPRGGLVRATLRYSVDKVLRLPASEAFLAYKNDKPIAAMVLIRTPAYIEIDLLFVVRGETACGVGHVLFNKAVERSRICGKPLIVWAMRGNHRARRFYGREGGRLFRFDLFGWGRGKYPTVGYRWLRGSYL